MAFTGRLPDWLGAGLASARPASLNLPPDGVGFFFASDTGILSLWDVDGAAWIDIATGGVSSVNGQTGAVSLGLAGLDDVITPSGPGFEDGALLQYLGGAWVQIPPGAPGQVLTQLTGAIASWEDAGAASERNTVTAVASTSGTVTLDYALGDYFTHTMDENITTLSFSNLPGSGKGASLMLRITQDSTPRTFAWPASFKWAGGSPPSISTASGAVDLLAITTFDNGTTWQATLAKAFA